MSKLVGALIAGVAAFAVTNTDDIFFLTIFFSQVNATFRPWHVVVGQYLGFTVIIIISLFGGLIVPESWVGILGLVPIAMGINRLLNWDKDEEE
ncbi:MAG TPA: cadmium resistance transporter, partial [Oculatellaceae cyanobacterium]